MRTAQQIFDTVVQHLRKQGCKSFEGDDIEYDCVYLSPEGHMCAVGCLISKSDYNISFEGMVIGDLIDSKMLPARLHNEFSKYEELLSCLQMTHDKTPIEKWESKFESIAKQFGLQYKKS